LKKCAKEDVPLSSMGINELETISLFGTNIIEYKMTMTMY
jgi:hypothetical protein